MRRGKLHIGFLDSIKDPEALLRHLHDLRGEHVDYTFIKSLYHPNGELESGVGMAGHMDFRGTDAFLIADPNHHPSDDTFNTFGNNNIKSIADRVEEIRSGADSLRPFYDAQGIHNPGPVRKSLVNMYAAYGRQHNDGNERPGTSMTGRRIMKDFVRDGFSNFITGDLHNESIAHGLPMELQNVIPADTMMRAFLMDAPEMGYDLNKTVIVSPDEGAIARSKIYAASLGVEMAGYCEKKRNHDVVVNGAKRVEEMIYHSMSGTNLRGKTVIVPDDLAGTMGTMALVFEKLREMGASHVVGMAAHGICNGNGKSGPDGTANASTVMDDAYKNKLFDKQYFTNWTCIPSAVANRDYVNIVDATHLTARAINCVHTDDSMLPFYKAEHAAVQQLKSDTIHRR